MTSHVVSSGVVSSGLALHDGDVESVLSGGVSSDTRILPGGAETISSGGVDHGAVVSGSVGPGSTTYGVQTLEVGATAYDARILSNGEQVVNGGRSIDARVSSHGLLFVEAGSTSGAAVVSGGTEILVGGTASGTTIRGGVETVSSGSTDSAALVAGGFQFVLGDAVGTRIAAGGEQYVQGDPNQDPGGLAIGAVVAAGGEQIVYRGSALGTTVLSGGEELDADFASGTKVHDGGTLSIGAGVALNAQISSGATLVDDGAAVFSGAGARTLAGAISGSGLIVEDGPGALVLSGAADAFTGEAVISGGALELASACGLGAGEIDFAPTSKVTTLKIDAADQPVSGSTFSTTLVDFESSTARVDLAGLTFTPGATATLSGTTLTIHDGAYTAAFTLSGDAASKYVVASDGDGGTLVHARMGAATEPLVHAMANFVEPGAPSLLPSFGSGASGSTGGAALAGSLNLQKTP